MKYFYLLLLITMHVSVGYSQSGSDSDYYLVDDFNHKKLTKSDQFIVDSCLNVFHTSDDALDQIAALSYLCDNLMDKSWKKFQAYNYTFIKKQLNASPSKKDRVALNKHLIDALNNLSLIETEKGNKLRAIELGMEAVEVSKNNSDEIGVSKGYSYLGHTYFSFGELKQSLTYFDKSNRIAEAQGLTGLKIQNQTNIAQINERLGNYDEALKSLKECLKYYKKEKETRSYAVCVNSMGLIYAQNGNYKEALDAQNKASNLFKEIGDILSQASAIIAIGDIYYSQDEYQNALKYYNKALKISRDNNSRPIEAFSLNSIANVHEHFGDMDKAQDYYESSLRIEKEIMNAPGIARCYYNLGKLNGIVNKYDKAIQFTRDGLAIYDSLNYIQELAQSHVSLAALLRKQDDLSGAKKHAELAFNIANKLGHPKIIKLSSKLLYQLAENEGDFEKAFEMHVLYIQMRDSLLNIENKTMVIRNQLENEQLLEREKLKTKGRDKIIKLKGEQNKIREQRYILVLLLFLAISIVFILLWWRSKYRLNIKWLQEEVWKSQMKPHFLSNVMVSIQSLIVQKRNKDAIEYLSEIASFTRSNLNVNSTKRISIEEEINLAEQYLKLEKLRFKEKLSFVINNNLDSDSDYSVSPLILQPLLENAIVHGFKNINYTGVVEVTVSQKEEYLSILIEDNGVGLSSHNNEASKGIKILKKRLALANSKNRLIIENRSNSSGVIARLRLYS